MPSPTTCRRHPCRTRPRRVDVLLLGTLLMATPPLPAVASYFNLQCLQTHQVAEPDRIARREAMDQAREETLKRLEQEGLNSPMMRRFVDDIMKGFFVGEDYFEKWKETLESAEGLDFIFPEILSEEMAGRSLASLIHRADWARCEARAKEHEAKVVSALPFWRRAVQLEPDRLDDWTAVARLLPLMGRIDEAEAAFLKVRELAERDGEHRLLSFVLNGLGWVHQSRGELARARELFGQALEEARTLGEKTEMGEALTNLGRLRHLEGKLEEAWRDNRQALTLFLETGDRAGLAKAYNHLGMIHLTRDQPEPALELFQVALELAETKHNLGLEALSHRNLIEAKRRLGQLDEGREESSNLLAIYRITGNEVYLSDYYFQNILSYSDSYGRHTKTFRIFLKSVAQSSRRSRQPAVEAEGQLMIGRLSMGKGKDAAVRDSMESGLATYRRLGMVEDVARGCQWLGDLEVWEGHWDAAENLWREAREIYVKLEAIQRAERLRSRMIELIVLPQRRSTRPQ